MPWTRAAKVRHYETPIISFPVSIWGSFTVADPLVGVPEPGYLPFTIILALAIAVGARAYSIRAKRTKSPAPPERSAPDQSGS